MSAETSYEAREWLAVTGRSLAFSCLASADLRHPTKQEVR
jgi:hypothetical protein